MKAVANISPVILCHSFRRGVILGLCPRSTAYNIWYSQKITLQIPICHYHHMHLLMSHFTVSPVIFAVTDKVTQGFQYHWRLSRRRLVLLCFLITVVLMPSDSSLVLTIVRKNKIPFSPRLFFIWVTWALKIKHYASDSYLSFCFGGQDKCVPQMQMAASGDNYYNFFFKFTWQKPIFIVVQ